MDNSSLWVDLELAGSRLTTVDAVHQPAVCPRIFVSGYHPQDVLTTEIRSFKHLPCAVLKQGIISSILFCTAFQLVGVFLVFLQTFIFFNERFRDFDLVVSFEKYWRVVVLVEDSDDHSGGGI